MFCCQIFDHLFGGSLGNLINKTKKSIGLNMRVFDEETVISGVTKGELAFVLTIRMAESEEHCLTLVFQENKAVPFKDKKKEVSVQEQENKLVASISSFLEKKSLPFIQDDETDKELSQRKEKKIVWILY